MAVVTFGTLHANGAIIYLRNGTQYSRTYVESESSLFMDPTVEFYSGGQYFHYVNDGYNFVEWNTSYDGTGTSYAPGVSIPSKTDYYAIWEEKPPVTYTVTNKELKSIADAIRTKGGTTASLVYPTGFVNAINDIQTGGMVHLIGNRLVLDVNTDTRTSSVLDTGVDDGIIMTYFYVNVGGTATASIQGSADSSSWSTIYSRTSTGARSAYIYTGYRYYRLRINGSKTNQNWMIGAIACVDYSTAAQTNLFSPTDEVMDIPDNEETI